MAIFERRCIFKAHQFLASTLNVSGVTTFAKGLDMELMKPQVSSEEDTAIT